MHVIKGLKNTYNILQTMCRGTEGSLLILYGWIEKIKPDIPVIHRERTEKTFDDYKELEQEITKILEEVKNWTLFKPDHVFIHGNFEEDEIRILNRIDARFKKDFNITISVQILDAEMDNKWIIEEV